jgi:cell division protein FtsA
MGSELLLVGCDFGTTTFRTLISELTAGGALRVVGCGEVPADGFKDGDFVDMRAGSRSIARAMRAVEAVADVDISAFYYNISGSHLRSVEARGQIQIGPGPRAIHAGDLEGVITKARSLAIPFDNWILAVNPVEYAVDRVRGIIDPLGRLGSQLEVKAHLITGSRSVVRNIEHAINVAGYEVAGRAVGVLATALALLSRQEKEQGVLLIDVGGKTTEWAAFAKGQIIGIGMVPWGGCHLTGDLAHGLRIGLDEAERIKCQRGVVLRDLAPDVDPEILFEEQKPEETPGLVAAILEPRLEEIFGLVKADLGEGYPFGSLGAGVVLTGGGSRCRGSAELCEEVVGLPVQARYLPPGLEGAEQLASGQWATAVGLSMWAAGTPPAAQEGAGDLRGMAQPILGRIRTWFSWPGKRGLAAKN